MQKALILGLGGIGQRHLRNIRTIYPNIEIAAVRERNRTSEIDNNLKEEKKINILEKYNIQTINHDAIEEYAPSFAVVCNPSSMHFSATKTMLNLRIPTFIEKPIATSMNELDELITLEKQMNVITMVGYQLHFHPCVIKAKEWLKNKRVGKIISAEVSTNSYLPDWHPYEDFQELYAAKRSLGGGVILTEIHEMDLITNIFGSLSNISAIGGNLSSYRLDSEDTISILAVSGSSDNKFPITFSLSFMRKPLSRSICIYGEKGMLKLDLHNNETFLVLNNEKTDVYSVDDFDRNTLFIKEIEHFFDSIKKKKETLTSIAKTQEGLRSALNIREIYLDINNV
mgnify:CR=1 FL=1